MNRLADKKITPEHDEIIKLTVIEHYEAHEKREESSLFRKTKKHMHDNHVGCFINNGKCEGNIEIHHGIIEWSAASEVDWDKVKNDYPNFTNVDQEIQMMGLCEKHHRHAGFGIHTTPYPIWILQKYMNEEALDDFERVVKEHLNKK
jgi:hypothetical protein